jgi:hypothetical protein
VRAETTALLRTLGRNEWFARVGKKERDRVTVLSSWDEAVLSRGSGQWLDTHTEAKNLISSRLLEVEDEASPYFRKWNKRVDKINPDVTRVVQPNIAKVIERQQLPDTIAKWIEADIVLACVELECADLCPPLFFGSLAHWYMRGHFPCGWLGDFPEGELVVY